MNYRHASLISVLLTPIVLHAQQEASTLEELCRRSRFVATARLAEQHETQTSHEARFVASRWWKGERKGDLTFTEAARVHCGSALHGLETGKDYVLFFEARGTRLRVLGGRRGLLLRSKDIEAAIQAMLNTSDPAARARLLAVQLSHEDRRIREDAALALANLPGLEASSPETRKLLLKHLDLEIQARTPSRLDSLLLASSRIDARGSAERAWTLALDERHAERSSLGREVLLRKIGSETTLTTVPMTRARTHRSRLLLLEVLTGTRSPRALPWVEKLLTPKDPVLQREVAISMLTLGSKPRELSKVLGKELVLQAETLRNQRSRKPRLKAIRPR